MPIRPNLNIMKSLLSHTLGLMFLLMMLPQASFSQSSINVNQMPDAFFQSWQGVNGMWYYDIRPEFFGVDNRLWTYENIIQTGDTYRVKVQDAFGETKEFVFRDITQNSMVAMDKHMHHAIELGPKPFDISFQNLTASDLPPAFYGTWSSAYGCGESIEITSRGINVNDGEWELHQIIREAGRYRVYLKSGSNYWLWLPNAPHENRLNGIFNDRIRLALQ